MRPHVRMTEEEYAHLKQQASNAGMTKQALIRALVAGSKLREIHQIPPALYRDISGIGTNLNQLARKANAGAPVAKAELEELLKAFERLLKCLS